MNKQDLDRYLHILENVIEDRPYPVSYVLGLVCDTCTNPARWGDFSKAEFLDFLQSLKASPRKMNRFYGEFGLLLHGRFLRPEDERDSAEATLSRLRILRNDLLAHVERRAWGDAESVFRRAEEEIKRALEAEEARAALADPKRTDAPAVTPAPRDNQLADRITVERVRFRVRQKSRRPQLLERLDWADQPGFVDYGGWPIWTLRVGDRFDVFWNNWTVWLHREPGVLDVVLSDRQIGVRDVDYDGRFVWIATAGEGVMVILPTGEVQARIDQHGGLPPWDLGLQLHPLSPGKVLAVGSFGRPQRAWCATLTLAGSRCEVDVFHEAREVANSTPRRGASGAEHDESQWGFVVCCIKETRSALDEGRRRILVNRKGRESRPLVVDPEQRTVRVVDLGTSTGAGVVRATHFLHLTNGDRLTLSENQLVYLAQDGRILDNDRTATKPLADAEGGLYAARKHAGHIYLPGDVWWRFNPETLGVERLGPGPLTGRSTNDGRLYGVSAHFGLLAWNKAGKVFRVHIAEPTGAGVAGAHTFRVVDRNTEDPIADASVEIRTHEDVTTLHTDRDGLCSLNLSTGLAVSMSAYVYKAEYVSRQVILDGSPRAEDQQGVHVVALDPIVHIGGLVRDGSGRPIAGMHVQARLVSADARRDRLFALGATQSDQSGRWALRLFPLDIRRLRVQVRHLEERHWKTLLRGGEKHALDALLAGEHVFAMGARRVLHGRVVDAQGNVIRGADVRLTTYQNGRRRQSSTRTDARGNFRLDDVAADQTTLIVLADGYAPRFEQLVVNPGEAPVEFTLTRGRVLRARAVDQARRPMSGVNVRAEDSTSGVLLWEGVTAVDGRFRWEHAPDEKVRFRFRVSPRQAPQVRTLTPAEGEQIVELQRQRSISVFGRVRDKSTGEQLARFRIAVGYKASLTTVSSRKRARPEEFVSGNYRLLLDGQPRGQAVRVDADGYAPQLAELPDGLSADIELNFELEAARGPSGRVLLADDSPLADAVVMLADAGAHPSMIDGEIRMQGALNSLTRADGGFEFPGQLGEYWAFVSHRRGYGQVSAEDLGESGTLIVCPWGRIEGRCILAGKPNKPIPLEFVSDRPAARAAPGPRVQSRAHANAAGEFAFDRLPPGPGQVRRTIKIPTDTGTSRRVYVNSVAVQVAAGEAARAIVRSTGTPVFGYLALADGQRIDTRRHRLTGKLELLSRSALPESDDGAPDPAVAHTLNVLRDGTFWVAELGPGSYRITIKLEGPGFHAALDSEVSVASADHPDFGQPLFLGRLSFPSEADGGAASSEVNRADFSGKSASAATASSRSTSLVVMVIAAAVAICGAAAWLERRRSSRSTAPR